MLFSPGRSCIFLQCQLSLSLNSNAKPTFASHSDNSFIEDNAYCDLSSSNLRYSIPIVYLIGIVYHTHILKFCGIVTGDRFSSWMWPDVHTKLNISTYPMPTPIWHAHVQKDHLTKTDAQVLLSTCQGNLSLVFRKKEQLS